MGLSENGIYSIALFMAMVIEVPRKFVAQAISPILAESFAKNDLDSIGKNYRLASLNQLIAGTLIYLIIISNLTNIYKIIPNGHIYSSGNVVFCIIGLVKLVDMLFGINGQIIAYSKYYRFNLYSVISLSIIAILSNYIMIPKFGILGAALATLFSYTLFNISLYTFIKIKFGFSLFSLSTLKIILISVIIFGINHIIPKISNTYFDLAYRTFLIAVAYIGILYFLKVSSILNDLIEKVITLTKDLFISITSR